MSSRSTVCSLVQTRTPATASRSVESRARGRGFVVEVTRQACHEDDPPRGIYKRAAGYARGRGIIIADTKFEFGLAPDGTPSGEVTLADEVLTPDSSRFWPADRWAPGTNPPSLDKQYLRDWLDAQGWDHRPPAPDLPPDVVDQTRAGYVEAYERLTGRTFS
jgi:phosphoribosylaminoimidazole-succinocarboxamide synthase